MKKFLIGAITITFLFMSQFAFADYVVSTLEPHVKHVKTRDSSIEGKTFDIMIRWSNTVDEYKEVTILNANDVWVVIKTKIGKIIYIPIHSIVKMEVNGSVY